MAVLLELRPLLHHHALRTLLALPVLTCLAASMGFVVNILAVCVIKRASSLTLKVTARVLSQVLRLCAGNMG
jgi:hypothetical protein